MKRWFRKFLVFYLHWTAKLVLLRHRPVVAVVSGSTRKTATKEKLYQLLSTRYLVRRNPRSYNTEVGVPISILGVPAGESSYFGWLLTMIRATFRVFSFRYPKVLLLEFGVSNPGDMRELTKIVKPKVAIFTTIEPLSGDSAVSDVELARAEQAVLLEALPPEGRAVINQGDPNLTDLAKQSPCPVLTYAASGGSEAYATAAAQAGAEALSKIS